MNAPLDLLVRGGTVVTATGRSHTDVGVRAGRVAHIGPLPDVSAGRVVDADGLLVLPGMVDTHVHFMDPGDDSREDFRTASMAAAIRGVTTVVEHTHGWPVTDVSRLEEKRAHLRDRSWVDYGLAAHVWPGRFDSIRPLWEAGVAFFKVFTCATHGVPAVTPDLMLELFETMSELGTRSLVHCEDDVMTAANERRLRADGRLDPAVIPAWRSREAELVALGSTSLLARLTGASITLAHVSHRDALDVAAAERRLGADVAVETCPQYLTLREEEILSHGALRKFTPPARIRSAHDHRGMWDAFDAGTIDILSSDHAPSTRAQKADGSIWDVHFGLPGIDTTLALMLTAAHEDRVSLERLIRAYSVAPARRYGLAGKGGLRRGGDADLILVDPDATGVIDHADVISRAGWTPYHGTPTRGRVLATFLRGTEVARDSELTVDTPPGRFLPGLGTRRD